MKGEEDFNILENALLFAPEGTPLWSDVDGVVTLERYHNRTYLDIEEYPYYPYNSIHIAGCKTYSLNGHYGEIGMSSKGSCVLWPSETHKTWKDWQKVLFKTGDYIYDTEKKRVILFSYIVGGKCYKGRLANGNYTEGYLDDCRYPSLEQIDAYKKESQKKSKLEASKRLAWVALRTMTDDNETAEEVERWNSDYEIGLSDEEVRELIKYINDVADNARCVIHFDN